MTASVAMTGTRRIVVACPNLALDRTIAVDELVPGHVHRAARSAVVGGGKGVNVARALAAMGATSRTVVMAGGPTGRQALDLLAAEGLPVVHSACAGDTRSCLTVLDRATVTVFNEQGPRLEGPEWRRYEREVAAALSPGGLFACSGSLPLGAPPDAVARLVDLAHEVGCAAACDCSGDFLVNVLTQGPELVAPNLAEAEAVLHGGRGEAVEAGPDALARAADAASRLTARGAQAAVVTAGAAGVAVASQDGIERLEAPKVSALNPVGAGDSLVAGVLLGLSRGRSLSESVVLGVAMASASCETFVAGALDPARVDKLRPHVLGRGPGRGPRRAGADPSSPPQPPM